MLQDRLVSMPTPHVGAVDDGFAPHAIAVIFVGSDAKFVVGIGFQIVDDRVTGGTCLIDPLPVPFSVTDCVVPTRRFLHMMNGGGRTDGTLNDGVAMVTPSFCLSLLLSSCRTKIL